MKDLSPITLVVFLGSILLEVWLSARDHRGYYERRDSMTNLAIAAIGFIVNVFFRSVALIFLARIGSFAIWHVGSGLIAILVLFLIADLCEYLFHLLGHKTRFLWAAHVLHHSSEKMNLTIALRTPFTNAWCRFMAYTPAALIGYSAVSIMWIDSLILIYSFFLHTEVIGKLGFLEYFMNTPSHHRVHHASNDRYIDKNFGAVLIIWDRFFGTFQEEEEKPVYGLTKPLYKASVLTVIIHEWKDLFRDLRLAHNWFQRLKIVICSPGAKPTARYLSLRQPLLKISTWVHRMPSLAFCRCTKQRVHPSHENSRAKSWGLSGIRKTRMHYQKVTNMGKAGLLDHLTRLFCIGSLHRKSAHRNHIRHALLLMLLMAGSGLNAQSADESLRLAKREEASLHYKEALASYKAAISLDPDGAVQVIGASKTLCFIAGMAPSRESKRTGAEAAAKYAIRACAMEPQNKEAHLYYIVSLGLLSETATHPSEKICNARIIRQQADILLAEDSLFAPAYYVLGKWNFELARLNWFERAACNILFGGLPDGASFDQSVRNYRRAISLSPEHILFHYGLACSLYETGDYEGATRELQLALQLKASDPGDLTRLEKCRALFIKTSSLTKVKLSSL